MFDSQQCCYYYYRYSNGNMFIAQSIEMNFTENAT